MKIHPLPRQRLGPAGVNLIELLIVMAIVGVVTTGMYSLFLTTSQTYNDQAVNAQMLQNATTAMKQITQDLRGGGTFWAPACAGVFPTAIASTSTANSLTIVTLLDDPPARTEIAATPTTGQLQTNPIIGVRSVTTVPPSPGWALNDIAYLTDGAQCTRFTVTEVVTGANPGLKHVPGSDTNSAGGSAYAYPVAASMVYRVGLSQTITYDLDTSDPKTTWLRRNNRHYAPDIQSLTFGYLDGAGVAVNPATNPANIRAVTVNLQVRAATAEFRAGLRIQPQRLTSTVQLRNFGS